MTASHVFDRAPRRAYWEVTRACDLACRHCRAEATPEADPSELTPEESQRLLHYQRHSFDDVFARNARVRAEDHRVIHDVYLAEVKPKSQVTEDWDYEKIVRTIPAAEAFRPVAESAAAGCKLG